MSSRGFFIRIYCNLLVSEELVRFAALDPDLQHLRVEPAYSPGSGLNVKVRFGLKSKIIAFCQDPKQREEIQKERQKLEDTLTRYIEFFLCILSLFDRFRSGETNTVVSTNVIEEGLDVRSCNLVIKFDFPATFRSYVQSKGRARAKPSRYLVMASTAETEKVEAKLNEFRRIEGLALKECHQPQDNDDQVK